MFGRRRLSFWFSDEVNKNAYDDNEKKPLTNQQRDVHARVWVIWNKHRNLKNAIRTEKLNEKNFSSVSPSLGSRRNKACISTHSHFFSSIPFPFLWHLLVILLEQTQPHDSLLQTCNYIWLDNHRVKQIKSRRYKKIHVTNKQQTHKGKQLLPCLADKPLAPCYTYIDKNRFSIWNVST